MKFDKTGSYLHIFCKRGARILKMSWQLLTVDTIIRLIINMVKIQEQKHSLQWLYTKIRVSKQH